MFILKSNTLRMTAQNHFCKASGDSIFLELFKYVKYTLKNSWRPFTAVEYYLIWTSPWEIPVPTLTSCAKVPKISACFDAFATTDVTLASGVWLKVSAKAQWDRHYQTGMPLGLCIVPVIVMGTFCATRSLNCFFVISLVTAWVALASSYAKHQWLRICSIKWTSKDYMWNNPEIKEGTSLFNLSFLGMHLLGLGYH